VLQLGVAHRPDLDGDGRPRADEAVDECRPYLPVEVRDRDVHPSQARERAPVEEREALEPLRRIGHDVAPTAQYRRSVVKAEVDRPSVERSDRVQPEGELGDDAEVAAAAA